MRIDRVILIVLDGVGAGAAPDADRYGDAGSNSLGNVSVAVGGLRLPRLARMGLGNITKIAGVDPVDDPVASWGTMQPAAAGKDSTTGHWELMGLVLAEPMPTYPGGFPAELIAAFEAETGRGVIGNRVASGTAIIAELGAQHVDTGALIVYTSADSVFQIAAHEEIVPPETLYEYCRAARALLVPPHAVGRVIARPFAGERGNYFRTPRRRDFALPPPRTTVLDLLADAGVATTTIGKIDDLFCGRGIAAAVHTRDNVDGMRSTLDAMSRGEARFVFTNLVDFDTMWGHRNDARAYALGLEEFDSFLGELLPAIADTDLLIITSDHGNDPTTTGTDHSRECVPLVVYNPRVTPRSLGTRATFADVGATVAEALGAAGPEAGTSMLPLLTP